MEQQDKISYFIEQTNKKLEQIEAKVDKLITFRVLLIGASLGVSVLASFIFHVIFAMHGGN